MNKREIRKLNKAKYLAMLKAKGYCLKQSPGCKFHYKDGDWNFYPTTGVFYRDNTHEKGKIDDLPDKKDLPKKKNKYYNLDKRYLPDWVLDKKRLEIVKKINFQ